MPNNKEKVTLSINSDILISAKKQAIDERKSLSAMVEGLLREYLTSKNPPNH